MSSEEHPVMPQPKPVPFRKQQPLEDNDPTKIGDFWLDSRLHSSPAGAAYVAHEDGADAVMLLVLSEGAAADPAARSRFSGEVNAMHIDTVVARGGRDQNEGRLKARYRAEQEEPKVSGLLPLAPWVALVFDGSTAAVSEASRVLNAVDLAALTPLSDPSGPDFKLHWVDATKPGRTRLWPLAWPGRLDRDGWASILVSWLLMILLSALGLLLALLAFQNAPLVSPPPPVGGGGSPDVTITPSMESSESGSASGKAEDKQTPSETPASAQPTENRRL